jgi:hypothetical protein
MLVLQCTLIDFLTSAPLILTFLQEAKTNGGKGKGGKGKGGKGAPNVS